MSSRPWGQASGWHGGSLSGFPRSLHDFPSPKLGGRTAERIRLLSLRGSSKAPAEYPPTVYVDGSCRNNGRDGAQGGIGVHWGPDHLLNVSERVYGQQTNQSAELKVAHKAIEQARSQNLDRFIIATDSKFVVKGVTEWMPNWKENGWKTASGRDVVNRSDFERIDQASQGMDIQWKYVPGHRGIKGKEAADRLATEGARKYRK